MSRNRTILVLNNELGFSEEFREHLAGRNCLAIVVPDPAVLIEELRTVRRSVVLLDLDMPGIDGLKLLQEIKSFDGSLLVIALVGSADQGTAIAALRSGAEDCVFKDASSELLLHAIDAAFLKIDRWWESLRKLAERKPAEKNAGRARPIAATHDLPRSIHCTSGDEGENRRVWNRDTAIGGELTATIGGDACQATITDTSFGGIGISVPNSGAIEVGSRIDLCYRGSTLQGIVRWMRKGESGNCRLGIQWPEKRRPPEHDESGSYGQDEAEFVSIGGLRLACRITDHEGHGCVCARLPDASQHYVTRHSITSLTRPQRRQELEQLDLEVTMLLGIYQLGESTSLKSAIDAILDLEYATSWN